MSLNFERVVSGTVSSLSSQINEITLRMPILAFHPYNNRNVLSKNLKKFKELIPQAPPSNYNHDCMTLSVRLNRISEVFSENVYLQMYDYSINSDFLRRFERFIVEGRFSQRTKFMEKYLIVLAAKELYLKTGKGYLNWFPKYYQDFLQEYRHTPPFAHVHYLIYQCSIFDPFTRPLSWMIPREFICKCSTLWSSHQEIKYDYSDDEYQMKDEVEITGIVSSLSNFGRAIGCSAASSFYALKAGNLDISQITNDFTADLMLLIANFNIYTITWAFVKLINRLFNIPNLFNMVAETFKYCYDSIKNLISPSDQPNTEEYESTSVETESLLIPPNVTETWFENFFKNFKESSPALCAIMATLLVISTGIFMGNQVFCDKSMLTKCKAKRVAEAFHVVSKTGVSIQKLYQILILWPKWVYEIAYEFLIGQDQTQLEEMLIKAEVIDPPDTPRREFFKEVEYLSNPVNTISISRNDQLRQKLLWCNNILTDMTYQIANRPTTEIKPHISQWVYTKISQVRQSLMSISRLPCNYSQRFVPFWINIIGNSGLGKTTLVPDILKRMKEVLKQCEEHKDVIPTEDRDWLYSLNFCSKHMTGYAGQYCVMIDDVFQDATAIEGATPSPLLLIQMVSSQPFSTIQASVTDKGIDFTSKIIISTSNDFSIKRKEIIDASALTRRMNVRIHMRPASKFEPADPLLIEMGHHQPVSFEIYTSDGTSLLRTLNYEDLITYLCDQYLIWYSLQNKLLERQNGTVNVDAIIRKLEDGEMLNTISNNKSQIKPSYKLNPRKIKVKAQIHSDFSSSSETIPKTLESPTSSTSTFPMSLESDDLLTTPSLVSPLSSSKSSYTSFDRINSIPPINKEKFESTRAYYCTVFGRGRVIRVPMRIPESPCGDDFITIEQYSCDCDTCMGLNRSYREHRLNLYATPNDILQISEFTALCSNLDNSNDITRDHINRSDSYWQKLQQMLKNLATHPLTIIIASISAIASMWYLMHRNVLDSTALQYSSGSGKQQIKPKLKIKNLEPIRFQSTNVTGFTDLEEELRCAMPNQNTYDLVYNKIIKKDSMCIVKIKLPNGKFMANSALRISGTCILTNDHFFNKLKQGDEFEVILHNRHTGMSTKKQIFNTNRYVKLGDIDACVYKCDNKLPHASSLVEHFVTNDIPNRTHNGLAVTIYDPEQLMCPVLVPNVIAKPYTKTGFYENQSYSILDTYSTNIPVIQGQSGSLLISCEPSSQNRILGILVCRSRYNNQGYFKPITQKSLNNALEILKVDENLSVNFEDDIEVTCAKASMPQVDLEYQSLNYLGKIPQNKQVSQAVTTKFVPSVIHDPSNVKFQPAVLHPYDLRMKEELRGKPIIYRAIKGFDEPIGAIDTYELDIAADELALEYSSWDQPPGFQKMLLDDYQMINGVKPYLKKLDMRTSPGYPFVKEKDPNDLGKYKWFNEIEPRHEQDGKVFEMKEDLRAMIGLRESRARQGFKIPTIAYMCLKDELRPNQKIIDGQTRVFTCLPMDYNLLIRKYFGAFIIVQHHNAGTISSCVGINPAKDWFKMWQRLESLNDHWEDFDYKNWDQHLHPELLMKVADIINVWYGDKLDSDAAKARRVLIHDLIHTTIMVKDLLFCKSSGQCSGCAITAELNCIVHDLLMYYVFRILCKQNNYRCDLNIYRSRVQTIMYGDDIVKSTPKGYFFVGDQIKPILDNLGMHITPGDKTSTEFTLKSPDSILFLKRNFTLDPEYKTQSIEQHTVRAPLKKDIIENIYQWVRKSEDPLESVRDNCETALREMFMYGKEEFDKQRSVINAKIDKYNNELYCSQKIKPLTVNYNNLLYDFDNSRLDLIGFEPNDLHEGFTD